MHKNVTDPQHFESQNDQSELCFSPLQRTIEINLFGNSMRFKKTGAYLNAIEATSAVLTNFVSKYFFIIGDYMSVLRKKVLDPKPQPWGYAGRQGGGQEADQDRRHPRHQELHREGEDQGGENKQRF